MKKFFSLLVIAGILCWVGFDLALSPVGTSANHQETITIERGMSVEAIANLLKSKELIRSSFAFALAARLRGLDDSLKAGTFVLSPSQSVSEILDLLAGGRSTEVRITVPEGFTLTDIDALMAEKGIGKAGDILDCAFRCDFSSFEFLPTKAAGTRELGYGSRLEGYLFPDTYFVNAAGYQPKFFLERLLGNFRRRVINDVKAPIERSNYSLSQIITMASLVEEESRHAEERATVAGILWKRLEHGVLLGVDATIRYVLNKPRGALTQVDLESDSLYNTRKRSGLPPTPIANPGLASIRAALEPAPSEYWYYLHDSRGRIHYATTNDEHNENRRRYLR